MIFCVMIQFQVFASNNETDPEFGKALREAVVEGVEIYAQSSEFIGNRITLRGKLKWS